jgi:hypothetical protein
MSNESNVGTAAKPALSLSKEHPVERMLDGCSRQAGKLRHFLSIQ